MLFLKSAASSIPAGLTRNVVDADINDDGPWFHPLLLHHLRLPHCHHQDVRLDTDKVDIFSLTLCVTNSCVQKGLIKHSRLHKRQTNESIMFKQYSCYSGGYILVYRW